MGQEKKKTGPLLRSGILALLAVLLFVIGWFVASTISAFNQMVEEPPAGIDLEAGADRPATGAFNLLLLGTDKGDYRTDSIMLVRVDLDQKTVDLLSLFRDTRIKLGSSYGKINAVFGREGMEGLIGCVKELTGAPVHYYALVDLGGFEEVVDVLGGVDFDIPRDMNYRDPYQNLTIALKKGPQHLDGPKAIQLVRFRNYLEGDVQRARVQQDFIKALIEQKLKPEYLLKLPELFNQMAPYVSTNITLGDVLNKASAVRLFKAEDAVTIHELPGAGGYVGEISYFLHEEQATYDLCAEFFGGTGAPEARVYTDYSKAAPMNPGGRPPVREPEPEPEPEPTPTPAEQGGSTQPPAEPAAPPVEPQEPDLTPVETVAPTIGDTNIPDVGLFTSQGMGTARKSRKIIELCPKNT